MKAPSQTGILGPRGDRTRVGFCGAVRIAALDRPRRGRRVMARFLLVHGAMGGAWVWERVIPGLEAAGHTAEAIDLPGG